MDSMQSVLRFFVNQKNTIGYSLMAIATVGSERIFTLFSFQCPCSREQNFAYGLIFLLGPAFVLLCLGLFLSSDLWKLYTGCCLNPLKLCPRVNVVGCTKVLTKIIAKAFVAPVMWLSVALLNGTFYECAISGLDSGPIVKMFCMNRTEECEAQLFRVPCGTSTLSSDENTELLQMLRAQSQILGWCLIITAAAVALIGTCYKNCRSQVSYLQLIFWNRYMDKEKEQFDNFADDYATKLAKRNLQSFFENQDPEAFPFPNHRAWEDISKVYTFSRSEQYYSTLQRFVESFHHESMNEKSPVLDLNNEHSLE